MWTNSKYLKAVDERAEKATKGPWCQCDHILHVVEQEGDCSTDGEVAQAKKGVDRSFIAAARTDVEVLSSRVKELEAALALAVQLLPQSEEWAYLDATLAAKPPGDEK
jgi:uncharacterized protein HemY